MVLTLHILYICNVLCENKKLDEYVQYDTCLGTNKNMNHIEYGNNIGSQNNISNNSRNLNQDYSPRYINREMFDINGNERIKPKLFYNHDKEKLCNYRNIKMMLDTNISNRVREQKKDHQEEIPQIEIFNGKNEVSEIENEKLVKNKIRELKNKTDYYIGDRESKFGYDSYNENSIDFNDTSVFQRNRGAFQSVKGKCIKNPEMKSLDLLFKSSKNDVYKIENNNFVIKDRNNNNYKKIIFEKGAVVLYRTYIKNIKNYLLNNGNIKFRPPAHYIIHWDCAAIKNAIKKNIPKNLWNSDTLDYACEKLLNSEKEYISQRKLDSILKKIIFTLYCLTRVNRINDR